VEGRAVARYIRVAPSKARLVMDLIRGKPVEQALAILRFTPRRASPIIEKVLRSAIANAEHNHDLDRSALYVAKGTVDEGPTHKRWHPRMRGQAFPIKKRTSHITVVVRERKE